MNNKLINIFLKNCSFELYFDIKNEDKDKIFLDFRSEPESDPDPLFHGTDPWIRIKMKWIHSTANLLFI